MVRWTFSGPITATGAGNCNLMQIGSQQGQGIDSGPTGAAIVVQYSAYDPYPLAAILGQPTAIATQVTGGTTSIVAPPPATVQAVTDFGANQTQWQFDTAVSLGSNPSVAGLQVDAADGTLIDQLSQTVIRITYGSENPGDPWAVTMQPPAILNPISIGTAGTVT